MSQPIKHPALQEYNSYFELNEIDGFTIKQEKIADLPIESGRIALADPMGAVIQMPFQGEAPIGKFPLEGCVAMDDEGRARLALLRWRWGSAPATSWHLAIAEDVAQEDMETLAPNEFIGGEFPYGIALIGDLHGYEQHLLAVQTHIVETESGDFASQVIGPTLADSPYGLWGVLHEEVLPIAIVTTGWGEGLFPAYWGVDESGEVVELVVDFFVLGNFEELDNQEA